MSIQFHLQAKDRAQHDIALKPQSSIEVEVTHSMITGEANQGGSFELQLFRRNEVSNEWELVGTATAGIGARTKSVFDELERGSEYAVGIYYKHYNDAIDSELTVDGNVTVH